MATAPLRYSPSVEHVQDDEAQTIPSINDTFDTILHTTVNDSQHAVRGVHAKSHGLLQGTLTVKVGLPPELAQESGLVAALLAGLAALRLTLRSQR